MIPGLPFHLHLVALLFIVLVGALVFSLQSRWRARVGALGALAALAAVLVWPMGDLAAHVSLTAAVVQRLVIMLVVVPLLLAATPTAVLVALTRPRPIDATVRVLSQPLAAVAFVTVVGTVNVSPVIVDWGARSLLGHLIGLAMSAVAGVVLWLPGLPVVPGARKLSPTGRAGYLFVSSIVVTVLSFIWIFARHPIYPDLHGQRAVLGISPLLDQQLAGFVAKFGAYVPLWTIAYTIFLRADAAGTPIEESPLHWADVERAMLRADRAKRHRGPNVAG